LFTYNYRIFNEFCAACSERGQVALSELLSESAKQTYVAEVFSTVEGGMNTVGMNTAVIHVQCKVAQTLNLCN